VLLLQRLRFVQDLHELPKLLHLRLQVIFK